MEHPQFDGEPTLEDIIARLDDDSDYSLLAQLHVILYGWDPYGLGWAFRERNNIPGEVSTVTHAYAAEHGLDVVLDDRPAPEPEPEYLI